MCPPPPPTQAIQTLGVYIMYVMYVHRQLGHTPVGRLQVLFSFFSAPTRSPLAVVDRVARFGLFKAKNKKIGHFKNRLASKFFGFIKY